jgi:transcription antitermination factor NusG
MAPGEPPEKAACGRKGEAMFIEENSGGNAGAVNLLGEAIGEHWYAVQTRSNFERRVAEGLQLAGVTHYLPVFAEVHQWSDRKRCIERPVFPGYVFVRLPKTPAARLSALKIHGSVRIVGCGREIEAIPDREIDSIRQMLASDSSCRTVPYMERGVRVRVVRGPLKNLDGVFLRDKGKGRLLVSIRLLCQSLAAEVATEDVEVISGTGSLLPGVDCRPTNSGGCSARW